MTEDLNFFWNEYTALKDWIVFSDAKAGAIIAFYGIVGGLLFPKSSDILNGVRANWLLEICFALSIGFAGLSIVCALWSYRPDSKVQQPTSLIFYSKISSDYKTADAYINAVQANFTDKEKIKEDLLGQIWALAHVTNRKFKIVGYSYGLLMVALIFTIIGIYIKVFG